MMTLLRKYRDNTRASVTTELVILYPLLVWVYGMAIVYYDAFKHYSLNLKAAYTVGDMLSRQANGIDRDYIDGLDKVFTYLTLQRYPAQIRVSSIYWKGSETRYALDWSYGTGDKGALNTEELNKITDRLPVLTNGERIILVQSWSEYEPYFPAGINSFYDFENFVVTSPRYMAKLELNG